jgi:hypothetical protein
MTKSYFKPCDFCKEKIEMSDKDGKWHPYNLNNGPHDCKKTNKPKEDNHNNGNNVNHSDISLELVLRKLNSIGVTIDLDVLRNSVNGNTK